MPRDISTAKTETLVETLITAPGSRSFELLTYLSVAALSPYLLSGISGEGDRQAETDTQ